MIVRGFPTQQHLLFLKWHVYDGLRNIIKWIKAKYLASNDDERFNEGIKYF